MEFPRLGGCRSGEYRANVHRYQAFPARGEEANSP
jgi:hypothetical protein